MCMSVPQIAVLAISMSTSLGPTFGSGMSVSQMPGAACCLTSAFMAFSLLGSIASLKGCGQKRAVASTNHAELAPDGGERLERLNELLAGMGRRHLRADACLTLR